MFSNNAKMTLGRIVLFCCFVGACFALTDDEIKVWFIQKAVECSKELPGPSEEFEKMKDIDNIPETKNAKCVVACVFKKVGMMDDKGMLDEVNAIKLSEKLYEDDKQKVEDCKKLYEICKKVNYEKISDADSSCERASLLATCFTEHAPQLGFFSK